MILVDTSVWIDHLRSGDDDLARLLDASLVLSHPFVIGELALGQLSQRSMILGSLMRLPMAVTARDDEVLRLIEAERLFSTGIGYLDAGLLAATRLTPGARLWTRDRRLANAAQRLQVAADRR